MNPATRLVPRVNPVAFPPGHRLVDQFGQPTTWEDRSCEIVMAPWPTHPTLEVVIRKYAREHAKPEGVCLNRVGIAARDWFVALDPQMDVSEKKLKLDHGRVVVAHMLNRGLKPASARRNMSIGIAALNYCERNELITHVPKFYLPDSGSPRMRWLTTEEVTRLLQAPKPPRIQRFLILAFGTGCRSEAIEELTWDRVDFKSRTINFRVPGVVYKTKKRPIAPINDALLPRLQSMHARRTDNYVIGLGRTGKPSCTFVACKRALASIGIVEEGVCRHVARHTFCSWRVQAGFSCEHIGALVGDDPAMIRAVYGHLSPHHLMAASNMDTSILRVAAVAPQ